MMMHRLFPCHYYREPGSMDYNLPITVHTCPKVLTWMTCHSRRGIRAGRYHIIIMIISWNILLEYSSHRTPRSVLPADNLKYLHIQSNPSKTNLPQGLWQ